MVFFLLVLFVLYVVMEFSTKKEVVNDLATGNPTLKTVWKNPFAKAKVQGKTAGTPDVKPDAQKPAGK